MSSPQKGRLIAVAVSLWVSFLSAGIAATLFFATFDPAVLAQLATYPLAISRNAGYTIGFLLFWVLLVLNSVAVIWLLNQKSK